MAQRWTHQGLCVARVESPTEYPELVSQLNYPAIPESLKGPFESKRESGLKRKVSEEDHWDYRTFDDGAYVKDAADGSYVVSVSPGVDIALIFALCWVLDRSAYSARSKVVQEGAFRAMKVGPGPEYVQQPVG